MALLMLCFTFPVPIFHDFEEGNIREINMRRRVFRLSVREYRAMAKHTILVVEDDAIQRKQILRALRHAGYTVIEASTGHETIRILESRRIDLILTDRKMPWMDGDWLISYVRTNYPKIPVVFTTAFPDGLDEFKPDATLLKPFSLDRLKDTIKSLIQKEKV